MSLFTTNRTLLFSKISPPRRTNKWINQFTKETSSCTCQNGTLTVEAAIVIPIASAVCVMFLFLFYLLHIQVEMEKALIYAGRKVAVESSTIRDTQLQLASAKAMVLWKLQEDAIVSRYVIGDSLGVSLLGSIVRDDEIELQANYLVRLPIGLLGFDTVALWNCCLFQKWTGDMDPAEEPWVYISHSGEVYHRLENCRALVIRVKKGFLWSLETIRGENGQKYSPCSRCVAEISSNDMVYFTDYGELYHQRLNCKHIKRSCEKVKLSETEGRRPCSLCCGGE